MLTIAAHRWLQFVQSYLFICPAQNDSLSNPGLQCDRLATILTEMCFGILLPSRDAA